MLAPVLFAWVAIWVWVACASIDVCLCMFVRSSYVRLLEELLRAA